eukprot:1077087-Ditylum_brightwellii.AAC.1
MGCKLKRQTYNKQCKSKGHKTMDNSTSKELLSDITTSDGQRLIPKIYQQKQGEQLDNQQYLEKWPNKNHQMQKHGSSGTKPYYTYAQMGVVD